MSKILLEDNVFIRTNLKTLLKTGNSVKNDDATNTNNNTSNSFNQPQQGGSASSAPATKKFKKDLNWKQELIDRIEANKRVTPDLKRPESEVIEEFWIDCFTTLWPQDIQDELQNLGEYFKSDLLNWGFSKNMNPLVAFINQNWVQKNLIRTKKLTIGTYSALHNAVLNKLVAQAEFHKANNYNIIYCLDLYNKSPSEIYKYLQKQDKVLSGRKTAYKETSCLMNRRVFLSLGLANISPDKAAAKHIKCAENKVPTAQKATLNNLDLVDEILINYNIAIKTKNVEEPEQVSDESVDTILNSLKTVSDACALLTYLYSSTKNDKIAKFMEAHQDKLKTSGNVPVKLLQKFNKELGKNYFSDKSLKILFDAITDNFLM